MSILTKEQLIEFATAILDVEKAMAANDLSGREARASAAIAEIALASLEAEPVAMRWRYLPDGIHGMGEWNYRDQGYIDTLNAYHLSRQKELLYTAPPAPVSVPDDVMAAIQKVARIRLDLNDFDGDKRGILDCLSDAEEALIEVVNRRAAMLQGAEPVTTAYKLPANTPCKDAPEHIWLQTAGVWPENGEFSELTWCSDNQHHDDTLYVRADVVSGNSPVIPDWQTQAEKMAELYGSSFVLFRNGESPQCADPTKVIISFTDDGLGHSSAAPQQEVK
ncbi:DUF551 domain-containing protein [Enterobacter roggenkampii]|nr:DUF551 domain-containing protein [Enterobacter roggenkampii]